MDIPQLLKTKVEDETYAGVTYHVRGELVPELAVQLSGDQSIFFEHHVLLWKTPGIEISLRPMKGMISRKVAGLPLLLSEAHGNGQVAFSRDGVGHVFAMHLQPGESIETREHQYLAATSNIDYSFTRIKGVSTMLFGGAGFFMDKFTCQNGPGILWLHGYGNVLEATLGPGEYLDVEPGGFLYKDQSVKMEVKMQGLRTGLFGGSNLVWNRFTGPGRLGIQTMYFHLPTAE
jgi:uncharacterized protein (AIM24 family)